MAQPKNTVYVVMTETHAGLTSPLAYHEEHGWSCSGGSILGKQAWPVSFNEATLKFGFKAAKSRLYSLRRRARKEVKKGWRPKFFLRKMKVSELKSHNNWPEIKNSLWAKNNGYAE